MAGNTSHNVAMEGSLILDGVLTTTERVKVDIEVEVEIEIVVTLMLGWI